jgi:hypothetical protein
MSDTRSKEADLAALKASAELNYSVASHPMFAGNPIVIAALANAKASDAAFFAAVVEADAARGLRIWSAYRHVRRASAASDKAHAALRAAVESAEDQHNAAKNIYGDKELPIRAMPPETRAKAARQLLEIIAPNGKPYGDFISEVQLLKMLGPNSKPFADWTSRDCEIYIQWRAYLERECPRAIIMAPPEGDCTKLEMLLFAAWLWVAGGNGKSAKWCEILERLAVENPSIKPVCQAMERTFR